MPASSKNISRIHHTTVRDGLGFGLVSYPPRGRFGPRRQGDCQLVAIHKGSMTVEVDGVGHAVGAGEAILLAPGREEYFRFDDGAETVHSWCQAPPDLLSGPLELPPAAFARPARCGRWLREFLRRGWELPLDPATPEGRRAMLGAVLCAMGQFCAAFPAPGGGRPLPPPLVRAERAMRRALAAPLPLDALAREAAVSRGHLIKLAREHWGVTPIERLWQVRLDAAARLLRETGLGAGEVAYRTGFANPFHFSRRFRNRFGKSPRAWRAAAWGRPA